MDGTAPPRVSSRIARPLRQNPSFAPVVVDRCTNGYVLTSPRQCFLVPRGMTVGEFGTRVAALARPRGVAPRRILFRDDLEPLDTKATIDALHDRRRAADGILYVVCEGFSPIAPLSLDSASGQASRSTGWTVLDFRRWIPCVRTSAYRREDDEGDERAE